DAATKFDGDLKGTIMTIATISKAITGKANNWLRFKLNPRKEISSLDTYDLLKNQVRQKKDLKLKKQQPLKQVNLCLISRFLFLDYYKGICGGGYAPYDPACN